MLRKQGRKRAQWRNCEQMIIHLLYLSHFPVPSPNVSVDWNMMAIDLVWCETQVETHPDCCFNVWWCAALVRNWVVRNWVVRNWVVCNWVVGNWEVRSFDTASRLGIEGFKDDKVVSMKLRLVCYLRCCCTFIFCCFCYWKYKFSSAPMHCKASTLRDTMFHKVKLLQNDEYVWAKGII